MARLAHLVPLVLLATSSALSCGPPTPPTRPPLTPPTKPAAELEAPPAAEAATRPGAEPVAGDVPNGADAERDAELARSARYVVDAFSNLGAELVPDGKHVVYRSTRDGILTAYVGDVASPEVRPRRLLRSDQRVLWAGPSRDGRSVLLLLDAGPDESTSFARADLDGAAIAMAVPAEPLRRDPPFWPAGTPDSIVYSARAAREAATRIYVQPLSAEPRLAYTDPSPGWLADVSADGKRALLVRAQSLSASTLAVVDLESGSARPLYPPAGASAAVYDASFAADGSRVLVATDDAGDGSALLALDATSGEEKARYVEERSKAARLREVRVAPSGDRIAVLVDAGRHAEVRVLDARTLAHAGDVAMPLGWGSLGHFSRDGKKLTATWSTSHAPPDVLAIDLRKPSPARLRNEARPTLAALAPFETALADVRAFDGASIPIATHVPREPAPRRPAHQGPGHPAPAKPLAVIVLLHGGPAASAPVGWNPLVRYYTSQGFAVVEPNVRGSSGFGRAWEAADDGKKRLDVLRDLDSVAQWIVTQPWADPTRLVVAGHSYGGWLSLMALERQPSKWAAGLDLSGPTSFRSLLAGTASALRETLAKELGDGKPDDPFLDTISPLGDVAKIAAPLFVYQGEADPRVPRAEADQLVVGLRSRGVRVEYMLAPGEGHSLDGRETRIALLARSARFLEGALSLRVAKE